MNYLLRTGCDPQSLTTSLTPQASGPRGLYTCRFTIWASHPCSAASHLQNYDVIQQPCGVEAIFKDPLDVE